MGFIGLEPNKALRGFLLKDQKWSKITIFAKKTFLREGLRGEMGEKLEKGEKIKLLGDLPFFVQDVSRRKMEEARESDFK